MSAATETHKKQRHFGPIEIIFSIGVALIAIGAVYFLITNVIIQPPIVVQTITGQKISVPAAWEMYTNKQYGFSIAHPSYYKVKESKNTLPPAVEATNRSVFSVDFEGKSGDRAPLGVNVTHQTLDQAVAYAKLNIKNYSDKKFKLTVTNDQSLTISGHHAVRIDVHMAGQKNGNVKLPDSDFTNVYIDANGLVYNLATELTKAKPFDDPDAQIMYKSFAVN